MDLAKEIEDLIMKASKEKAPMKLIDINSPSVTITHTLIAEHSLARAHDYIVESFGPSEETKAFGERITFHDKKDLLMECLYNIDIDALKRVKESLNIDWTYFNRYTGDDEEYYIKRSLSDEGKILFSIVEAVKNKLPQIDFGETGSYTTDKVLGCFWVSINVFKDDDGEPYVTMELTLINGNDNEGTSW